MSAEDAIARAKAIAARLAGTGAMASLSAAPAPVDPRSASGGSDVNAVAEAALSAAFGGGGSTGKRKRWGTESSSANPADAVSDALAAALSSSAKRPTLNSHYESSQKIYIPVDQNPGYNYIGLLIGPGGAKQRELVSQSGGNVKISIRGKGSSSSNAVPGQPEEPLHVALEGSVDSVAKAQALVNELLNDSTKAQAEKEKQLAVVAGSKGDSHGQGFGGSSTYQPKPVAQLLGLNANHYGPAPDATEVVEEKIGVPNGVVGFIIGKGGESITSMQRKSGCRVQIQKEHEMESGTTQRIITLIGATQESVSMCRGIIEEMVKERLRLNDEQGGGRFSGPGNNAAGQAAQLQTALSEGHQHVQVRAPNNDVGLIIGKGGMTIRSIQERSGANVQIPQAADGDNPMVRTINITHPSKEGAEFAKTLIEEVLNSKTNHSGGTSSYGGGNAGNNPSDVSVQIQIPDKDVGMCIGKAGCVIREMQQRTQTRIQIPSMPTPGQMNRIATVSGSADGCAKVQEIINRIIVEQSSQFVMTGAAFQSNGGGYGGYGQQQQQQQQYGQQQYGAAAAGQQPDYSAQWAAYYASQAASQSGGASATATASTTDASQSNTASAATGAEASSANQAPDAYYDAFFRYSYHYGEDAARKYYGAWSPPEGSTNPYGTNPAAASGANAPSTATSSQPAATAAPVSAQGQVRDSSQRKHSNLPAWMTKG